MTKQGFIASYKYQLHRNVISPILSLLIGIISMILMMGTMNYILDGSFSINALPVGALDALAAFLLFTFGAVYCHEFMNTGAANGVSRSTTVAAAAASFFTSSVVCSAFISIITPLKKILTQTEFGDYFLIETMYGTKSFYIFYGENPFVVRIRLFVMISFMLFFCASFGFACSSVYYRISRNAAVILSVVVAVFFIFGYPVGEKIFANRGINFEEMLKKLFIAWCRLFGIAHANGSQAGNCVQGAVMMLLFSAAFLVISWLFARRANAKPAPIRGE